MSERVLVASNRGPVSYQFGAGGSLTGTRGGGGMIAGVASGLAAVGLRARVTWICTHRRHPITATLHDERNECRE